MKIGKEIYTVLQEKPSRPPAAGYIYVYSWKDYLWYMDSAGKEYLLPGTGGLFNQLIKGSYEWISGLSFYVSECLYIIQGTSYESAADTIDLDAADPDLDRVDVIYLDNAGLVGKITGTPSLNPAKPLVDSLTQLELTSVIIPALATEPGGISNGYIYRENTEWTTSKNTITGVGVDFESTNVPYAGTKCIEVRRNGVPGATGWNGQYLKFVRPTGTESILSSAFVLSIKNALKWRRGDHIEITLALGTGIISTVKVIIKDGAYGFNSAITAWQKLVIPIEDFAPAGYNIDTVYITFSGVWSYTENLVGFDEIFIQAGNTQVTGHERAHSMTNPLDHAPVLPVDYDKIPHTNAVNGYWELIDTPTGTTLPSDSAYVYIAYASDAAGTGFTLTFNAALDYIAIKSTTTAIESPQASDFTGLWKNYKGTPGTDGDDGLDGDDAYVYIAYASSDAGAGFTMTFDPALDYIAIRATTAPIAAPQVSDFTGLWKNYKGAPGDNYDHWDFNVDTTDNGDVNTPITSGEKIYFKEGAGIKFKRSTDVDLGHVMEVEATGGSGGSTNLTAVPTVDKTASGITTDMVANENQAFGDLVRINSLGKAQIAKGDVIANATAIAMCVDETILADATGKYLLLGFVRNDAWNFTIGEWIYLSLVGTTGNTLTQENPSDNAGVIENNVIQMLGVANSTDSFYFNPQLVQVEWKPETT